MNPYDKGRLFSVFLFFSSSTSHSVFSAPPGPGYAHLDTSMPGYNSAPYVHVEAKPVEYNLSYQHEGALPQQVSIPPDGFAVHITSLRHHKFVSMNDMEVVFTHELPCVWVFSPSPVAGAFLISVAWAPAPSIVPLQMQRPVAPVFLRAVALCNWEVRLGFDPSTEEYLWRIEQNAAGSLSFRNLASARLVSAESRCLRANRTHADAWEVRATLLLLFVFSVVLKENFFVCSFFSLCKCRARRLG
jgi:hypothetical protein